MIPACFDSPEQYREWVEANDRCDRKAKNYCDDCTPTYQREMRKAFRCAYPYTRFVIKREDDGLDITGVRRGRG